MKVGVLGYGGVGRFLAQRIPEEEGLELAFVWNRTSDKLSELPKNKVLLGDLNSSFQRFIDQGGEVDLIVEVAHPSVLLNSATSLLEHADLFPTSITAFAHKEGEQMLAERYPYKIYIPGGAAWGLYDILKMRAQIQHLEVEMEFNGNTLPLEEPLASKLEHFMHDPTGPDKICLFDGPVRELAKLAPNNVNSMTAIAIAGIGVDQTIGRLYALKQGHNHKSRIKISGTNGFSLFTERINHADPGSLTGKQTYQAFLASIHKAKNGLEPVNFC